MLPSHDTLLLTNTLENISLYTSKGCSLWLEGRSRNLRAHLSLKTTDRMQSTSKLYHVQTRQRRQGSGKMMRFRETLHRKKTSSSLWLAGRSRNQDTFEWEHTWAQKQSLSSKTIHELKTAPEIINFYDHFVADVADLPLTEIIRKSDGQD